MVRKKGGGGSSGSLGQALIRSSKGRGGGGGGGGGRGGGGGGHAQRADGPATPAAAPLTSIIDHSDLDELMLSAELAGRDFAAQRGEAQLILTSPEDARFSSTEAAHNGAAADVSAASLHLTVPRRPPWHVGMSAEQLDAQEKAAFLEWRRGLARVEESKAGQQLTPFEKNLDVWRQLWRVVERSQVVVTVVDSRNPLFYRCPDLEAYVKEVGKHKTTLVLLNKADLLPRRVRLEWADYFRQQGTEFAFWSARAASEEGDGPAPTAAAAAAASDRRGAGSDAAHIYSRSELLSLLEAKARAVGSGESAQEKPLSSEQRLEGQKAGGTEGDEEKEGEEGEQGSGEGRGRGRPGERRDGPVVVGFVGYPNVGKSSTINALIGSKKTGVTSTPGKTKHFQTLPVTPGLTLCDCPGLVFPSVASSRSEMVSQGVLPVDRITDQRGPVEVVCQRVARADLEKVYGIRLPAPAAHEPPNRCPTAAELLRSYARSRGYVSSSGLPDETRSARKILKDYLDGRLRYFLLPPKSDLKKVDGQGQGSGPAAVQDLPEGSVETPGSAVDKGEEGEGRESEDEEDEDEDEDDDDEAEWVTDDEDGESEGCEGEGDDEDDAGAGGEDGNEGRLAASAGRQEREGMTSAASSAKNQQVQTVTSGSSTGPDPSERQQQGDAAAAPLSAAAAAAMLGSLDLETQLLLQETMGISATAASAGQSKQSTRPARAPHKMHKKVPRRKDRSWRAKGDGEEEGPYASAAASAALAASTAVSMRGPRSRHAK